jgi:hypothetical protein
MENRIWSKILLNKTKEAMNQKTERSMEKKIQPKREAYEIP